MKRIVLLLSAITCFCQPPGGGPPMQQGDGIWSRDAYFGESITFDACNGHQPGNGQYHHHASPTCLRAQLNDNLELVSTGRVGSVYREKSAPWTHSPILGWAFDGNPIYGPYGYSDPANAAGAVRRMRTGFQLRNVTNRQTLPAWSLAYLTGATATLTNDKYGPDIDSLYPLGRYAEDYEFVDGLGDLDVSNGRMTVTPEFPKGTYAYFITVDEKGTPLFPYVLGRQYFGTVVGGQARTVPAEAKEYAASATETAPLLTTWATRSNKTMATAVIGFDPSAGASTTWPANVPAGTRISGGVSTPTAGDIQRVRTTDSMVYVNSNQLPTYTIGPWFDSLMPGGVFGNFPATADFQVSIPRTPASAATKTATGLGPVGIWVNGVAAFNGLDGASYRTAVKADAGGGFVSPTAVHVSAASYERGPLAKGSLVAAFSLFGSKLASGTMTAASANWPTDLAGTTVTIKDSGGVTLQAPIYYVSPTQVNYLIPATAASGFATVTVSAGGAYTGNINIADTYPGLLGAAYVTRVKGAAQTVETITPAPVDLGPDSDQVFVAVFGSGLGKGADVKATIGGVTATVAYAGEQGTFSGLDQYNILVPRSLAGRGRVDVVVTSGGKGSNTVSFTVR